MGGFCPFLARRLATAFQSPHSAGVSRGILPLYKTRITEFHKLNMFTLDTHNKKKPHQPAELSSIILNGVAIVTDRNPVTTILFRVI